MNMKKAVTVLFYFLGLIFLVYLGIWQLNRGLHKAYVVSLATTEMKDYQGLAEIPTDFTALEYSKARLKGQWLPQHSFLLDNRLLQGQAGYEVLTPYRLNSGQILLVNRGWIEKSRQHDFSPPQDQLEPGGMLYQPKKGFTLGNALLPQADWPKISLYLDTTAMGKVLQEPLSPLMLVLDADDKNSFTRIWTAVVVSPERHYAYAAQWFGMALVFLVFGFIWRKHFLKDEQHGKN